MKITESLQITRYENGHTLRTTDTVITEYSLAVNVNGTKAADILCTPTSLCELVMGFLFCKGNIHAKEDVIYLRIDEDEGAANALLNPGASTCGAVRMRLVADDFTVSVRYILEQAILFYGKSTLFAATGAIHSCCLCGEGSVLCFEEDISRHNAVDKVIGRALLDGVTFNRSFLITSGRVPSDMLVKIIRCGIPIIVSRSAPTDTSVAMAKEHNVTLAGFARGRCINIYSGEQRILLP